MAVAGPTDYKILSFRVKGVSLAVPVGDVVRVELAPEITPLPDARPSVEGVVTIAGEAVPVISVRRRMGLPHRRVRPSDRLVIVQTSHRSLALLVDEIDGLVTGNKTVRPADDMEDIAEGIRDIVVDGERIIIIYAVDRLISEDEDNALAQALEKIMKERAK